MPVRTTITRASRRTFLKNSLTVAAVLPALSHQAFAASRKLNIYNFDTYIGPTTLDDFTKATGIETRYDLYADNAELFARLREGNPGYDLICPTNDTLDRMIHADMLVGIDHSKIPNMKNLEPRFMESSYDVGRKFSVPYFWGTVGIGYRKSAVSKVLADKTPDSWNYIYGDEGAKFAGRMAWSSDIPTIIGAALKMLGHSLNSTVETELKQAEEILKAHKKNARTIAGDNGQDLLLASEVDLAVDYNGDIAQVAAEDNDLTYVLPKEGTQLWDDSWAIPKGGPDAAAAHEFINYILTPEVHASIAKVTNYALPNAAAKALMPDEYKNNPMIFPSEEAIKVSEYAKYLGEDVSQKLTDLVTRIRAE